MLKKEIITLIEHPETPDAVLLAKRAEVQKRVEQEQSAEESPF